MSEQRRRLRLLIVLRSFSAGGAERQLLELLRAIDVSRFDVAVVCFYSGPWHSAAASIPGIKVELLEKRGRWDLLGFLWSFRRAVRRFRPDLVYGYMFAADLMALLAARLNGARVVFGLRSSEVDFRHYDRFTRFLQWSSRRVARFADLVISNSQAGLDDYRRGGALPRQALVIPNGIDCQRFHIDPTARAAARTAWGLSDSDIAIGIVARLDPMKGHDVFLDAARTFLAGESRAVFICVGGATAQNDRYARQIRAQSARLGIESRVRWVGQSAEPEKIYPGLDLLTSASRFGEGFSNSVAEAMACGVPCVVTRVGDSAHIVGEQGVAVPAGIPDELAAGWRQILENPERFAPEGVRDRITREFAVERMASATEAALTTTFAAGGAGPQL